MRDERMRLNGGYVKGIGIACLFLITIICTWLTMGNDAKAEREIIRVGYIDYNGFIELDRGSMVGYGVEYLDRIGTYTGWEFEYIYGTWEECLNGLKQGQIDMICSAQYTEERANIYAYSDMPLGYESTILYVPEGSDIYYDDFEAMNGTKVGLLYGTYQTEEFVHYAEMKGLEYEAVYFKTATEIESALENGQIDMAAVGSLNYLENAKAVGQYGAEAYYCMVGKGNEALVEAVDEALKQIRIDEPGLEKELSQKYYGIGEISTSPLFTREEHEYIEQANTIKIYMMGNARPLSYEMDGESAGILTDYLKLIAEKSGLKFELVMDATTETLVDGMQRLDDDVSLLLHSQRVLEYTGMDNALAATNAFFETELSYVKHYKDVQETGRKDYTFALTKEMLYLESMLWNDSGLYNVIYYDSSEKCLDAVMNGAADIAIQDTYVMKYMLQKPLYADALVECPGGQVTNGMCLITAKENQTLVNIINKTINYISATGNEDIATTELLMNPYERTFGDTMYEYRHVFLATIIGVVLLAIVYTILVNKMAALKIEKNQYEILKMQVRQDDVTGVYNRTYFYEKARKMIDGTNERMCIVLMDIINFKVVNDLYGMESGDKVLRQIAQELQRIGEKKEFIVARFTGDHFYICMKYRDFQKTEFPQKFKTFLEDMEIKVNYGVFVVEEQKDLPINIMCDRASLPIHDKDRNRLDYIFYYSDENRNRILQEQEIENEMEKALESRQFCVYIQPKYDVNTREIIGGEALVRWIHPQKGMISPAAFISLFEKNGFILRLDYFVWEETCRLIAELKKRGVGSKPISINVSRAHFYGKELQDKLEELIAKYELNTTDIELEITETICAEDSEVIHERIVELQKAGFKIAMDDFGSGYSSLNMLKEIPLDILKMDLRFLEGGEDISKSHNILQTLIYLARSLKLSVVVEGVETEEQVEFLQMVGHAYAQGYYFSRPVDCVTYEAMLRQN